MYNIYIIINSETVMKKFFGLFLAMACFVSCFPLTVAAENDVADNNIARNITSSVEIDTVGFTSTQRLTDGVASSGGVCASVGEINIKSEENIGSVYILFNSDPVEWRISSGEQTHICGKQGFLHEYIDISSTLGNTQRLKMSFGEGFNISEIYIFSVGERPEWVQVWEDTCESADLLLFSAHSDDDQLFFAGLIPLYVSRGYKVQVAYMTYHPENVRRRHEFLDGLWCAGATYYPLYGKYDDFRIDDLDGTVAEYHRRGTSYSDIESFVIGVIRRTHPLVLVSHDINGEYGHGMHRLLSNIICNSPQNAANKDRYTDSAKKYGTWCAQKIYIHLYSENKITLDIDTPLEAFGNKTAFQVSQQAFLKHKTQLDTWFNPWLRGATGTEVTSSTQIIKYNPARYGLYYTQVGNDTGNDMFENIVTYTEYEKTVGALSSTKNAASALNSYIDKASKSLEELNRQVDVGIENKALSTTLSDDCRKLGEDIEGVRQKHNTLDTVEKEYTAAYIAPLSALPIICVLLVLVFKKLGNARENR